MICFVALDQVLRLFLRRTNRVVLERHGGRDLFLDLSSDVAGFRVPLNMIPNFEFVFHLLAIRVLHLFRMFAFDRQFASVAFLGRPGCVGHLVLLRFSYPFFDELRSLAPPFAVLVFAKRHRFVAPRRTPHGSQRSDSGID